MTMNRPSSPVLEARTPRCPISHSRNVTELCVIDGYSIWRCAECATDFVWPVHGDGEPEKSCAREALLEETGHGGRASDAEQAKFSLPLVESFLDSFPPSEMPRYVLELGCGYGTHLALAADRGWKCFGVETSEHARKIALEHHSDVAHIVARIDELTPHEFDLILMLDVLEHKADPYAFLFSLFNQGLIGYNTRLVITTPNARSVDAVAEPANWAYRHPPSNLVYYSARSLEKLLETILFENIEVRGTNAIQSGAARAYEDENLLADEALSGFDGLICQASSSRFHEFMQERYVPGTWSKLAEYEHMPRYQFARQFAGGARVLDFGCGTGYGSRFLADAAEDVLGLDIDAAALKWARTWHDSTRLRFERRDDLGAGLPAASFNLITCFEMIEHVDHATQIATVENLSRLLTRTGKLIISTPNPEVTKNYGVNPYHLREMNEEEFRALLAPSFAHVRIVKQWIRPSILIGHEAQPFLDALVAERLPTDRIVEEPPAFIAICSHEPIETVDPFCSFDSSFDMVLAETELQKKLTGLRFENYLLHEGRVEAERRALDAAQTTARADEAGKAHANALVEQMQTIEAMRVAFATQEANIEEIRAEIAHKQEALALQAVTIESMRGGFAEQDKALLELHQKFALQEQIVDEARESAALLRTELTDREQLIQRQAARNFEIEALLTRRSAEKDEITRHYVALENTRSVRLARLLRGRSESPSPVLESAYLIAGGLIPRSLKAHLAPMAATLRERFTRKSDAQAESFKPYAIKPPAEIHASRPRVLHVIANFMTGGSSRLVVDLLEHLGGEYEQRILTSFIPDPPNYVGADITEIRQVDDPTSVRELIANFNPHIVHVHYWGDCDEPWYRLVFEEARKARCKLVQNINTPVAPFPDAPVDRNVFVSRYVLDHFGDAHAHNTVVYPGSDFSLFNETRRASRAQRCIGMVYRLERDKLNETAIEPFVEAARLMPGLKCLIVGGGSLLEPFKERVRNAGLEDSFEFPGYVSYQSLPALYKRMDVFVAPIWKESFGQVSAFAMNMGIPVIGYDVGAIPEIVADPSLIASAGDSVALAAIAIRLVRDDAAREAIGVANQKRAGRMFSVEAMIGSYRDLYRDLMNQ